MRILIFGPNGSGKGTQSSFLIQKYGLAHVESGGIFRKNIQGGTPLGQEALKYINKGELVPDDLTIPMVLDRLAEADCQSGFVLDGFPRTENQAQKLVEGLDKAGTPLDLVIVIELAREVARARLLGRRACPAGHPNNTAIEAISPKQVGDAWVCWKCNEETTVRKDDIDAAAIDQRLDIYFSDTLASIEVVKEWATLAGVRVLTVQGDGEINAIRETILSNL